MIVCDRQELAASRRRCWLRRCLSGFWFKVMVAYSSSVNFYWAQSNLVLQRHVCLKTNTWRGDVLRQNRNGRANRCPSVILSNRILLKRRQTLNAGRAHTRYQILLYRSLSWQTLLTIWRGILKVNKLQSFYWFGKHISSSNSNSSSLCATATASGLRLEQDGMTLNSKLLLCKSVSITS